MKQIGVIRQTSYKACLILAVLAVCIQLLFCIDQPAAATLVLGAGVVFAVFSRESLWPDDALRPGEPSLWLPLLLWIGTIALRSQGLIGTHSIHDLPARFMVAAIEITRGNLLFPCIPGYEFDEVLVSWLFAPTVLLFDSPWVAIKITSITLSSLVVPAGYLFVRHLVDRDAALPAAGFLMASSYFQFSDSLIDMTRFTLVATLMLLAMIAMKQGMRPGSSFIGVLFSALLTVVSAYLHSLGRIVFVIVLIQAFLEIGEGNRTDRMRARVRLAEYAILVILPMIPFIGFIMENPAYTDFKARQLFGIHEAYPFTWSGLADNIRTVLGSFTYRSMHHMLFSETRPLMHPLAGAGAIGGILLLIRRGRKRRMTGFSVAIMATIVPLIFLTPGHWRGLYVAPALVMLNLLAGVFYSWCLAGATGLPKRSPWRFVRSSGGILMILVIGGIQLPWITGTPGKAPESDQLTRLYADLQDAPDVPHYFSTSVGGLKPGYALFDLFDLKVSGRAGLIDPDGMLVTDGMNAPVEFSDALAGQMEIRLVLAPEDMRFMPGKIPGNQNVIYRELPDSGLILVVIRSAS